MLAATVPFATGVLCSKHASAQASDDETRAAARQMARRGADAFDEGNFETAYDLFNRAYALMPVPSISVYEARAAEKLGKLVEALDAYERTVRYQVGEGTPEAFAKAVDEARVELSALRPRIPSLKVVVQGRGKDDPNLEVTLDGKPMNRALLGVDSPTNPGDHRLEASTPWGASAIGAAKIAEGENKTVTLHLEGGDPNATATGCVAHAAPRLRRRDSRR